MKKEAFMKTSTAESNNYVCPACGDELANDHIGRGYVRHKTINYCLFERGEQDENQRDNN